MSLINGGWESGLMLTRVMRLAESKPLEALLRLAHALGFGRVEGLHVDGDDVSRL